MEQRDIAEINGIYLLELLLVTSDASGVTRPGLLHLGTGEVHWLGREGVEEGPVEFSANGRFLVTVRNQDATRTPVLYNVATGDEHVLRLPPGVTDSACFALDDTKLVIQHSAANRRGELVLYDLRSDTYEVILQAEYGSIDPGLFVTEEYVTYPSADGELVPSILYKPRNLKPGERRPAVIDVHGGPRAQSFRAFHAQAQLLADRGFVVLRPNYRGSTGYGTRWRDANLRDLGGGDHSWPSGGRRGPSPGRTSSTTSSAGGTALSGMRSRPSPTPGSWWTSWSGACWGRTLPDRQAKGTPPSEAPLYAWPEP